MFMERGHMKFEYDAYIIDRKAVPESLIKAHEVNALLENDKSLSVLDAVKKVGISRSAYYKYKDMIKPYRPLKLNKVVTLFMELYDVAGNLSSVLNIIAKTGANVLTINQNIPVNGKANISISIDTGGMQSTKKDIAYLEKKLKSIEHISSFSAVGNE